MYCKTGVFKMNRLLGLNIFFTIKKNNTTIKLMNEKTTNSLLKKYSLENNIIKSTNNKKCVEIEKKYIVKNNFNKEKLIDEEEKPKPVYIRPSHVFWGTIDGLFHAIILCTVIACVAKIINCVSKIFFKLFKV